MFDTNLALYCHGRKKTYVASASFPTRIERGVFWGGGCHTSADG